MLTFSLVSLCVQNSCGNNGPAGEARAQQARNKWDHLKNKYKVAAGLSDDVETKLYLFYPCKLINNLLKVADVIDFHCLRIANIQGQQRVSGRPTPGPSDQEEESQLGPRRKRKREDEGTHEVAERMERLFSAPEDNPYIISVVI